MSQKGFAQVLIIVLITILTIGGYLVYTNYSNNRTKAIPSTSVTNPSPTPAKIDEIANWKTYTDPKNDFSLRYPLEVEVTTQKLNSMLSAVSSDGISIAPPYQAPYGKWYSFDLVVRDNPQNLDSKMIINNYIDYLKKNATPPATNTPAMIQKSLKEYKNGDIDGFIFHIGAETDSAMVVQTKNNKTYIFRMTGDQGNVTDYGLIIFNQILSTFKFQ